MELNWTGKVAGLFVKNRQLSLLLILALFIWGSLSFLATAKQYNPKITAPAFQITIDYPGASRSEVLEQITKPLEGIISDIPEVEDIYSTSMRGGRAVLIANFFVGEDPQYAKITLTDRINSNFNKAPSGINPPLVQSIDPDDVPIMTLAVKSNQLDPVELRKLGFRVRDRLVSIEGTSNVDVIGGRSRELAIQFDPVKLKKSGIGIQAIKDALQRENIYLPSGVIKSESRYIPVETSSRVTNPENLKNLVVVTGDFGQTRLQEIATVSEEIREIEDHVRHTIRDNNGKIIIQNDVVLLSIAKHGNANSSTVTDQIKERLDELRQTILTEGNNVEILVNEGRVASEEISRLVANLLSAIAIVVAILLVFLDRRAAFLVSISIPLTLAMVFGIGQLAGQNINRITLFALILSLGLLVDNATVVIENIVRWVRQNQGRKKLPIAEVIVLAVNEVGPGLFMSTITTVLAFIPMAFIGGMMGPYMGPIPFFVPAAIIISLIISLTLNPYMASVFLDKDSRQKKKSSSGRMKLYIDKLSEIGITIMSFYHKLLHSMLVNRKKGNMMLLLIVVFLLICFALPAVKLVKFRMLPKADREQFFLYIDMPNGTPLEKTNRIARQLEAVLLKQKEVKMIQSYVGRAPIQDFNGLFRGVSARIGYDQATLRVGLTHPDERDIKSSSLVLQYRRLLEKAVQDISPKSPVYLKLVEDPPGPPVLSTLLIRIQGYDEKLLNKIAADMLPHVNKVSEVVDTELSTPETNPAISLMVDQKRASLSRISSAQIIQVLHTAYSGSRVGFYHNSTNLEQEYITLRLHRKFRQNENILNNLFLTNDLGIKIPLLQLVDVVRGPLPLALKRENRKDTVYIYGDMASRSITYAAIDLLYFLADYTLPDGKGKLESWSLFGMQYITPDNQRIDITIGGEWELTLEVFRDLGIAMCVAIFLIYFVLVAQFSSFSDPLVIMATIPLSLIGVLPGFFVLGFLTDLYFNATSMIGVIALAGIAVNNSIILLEYLNDLKGTKINIEEALLQAGVTRFRPIMLTTFTTVLGSFTIINDPVWSGLAYAIIFGLGVSSILTLFVFPVLYALLNRDEWKKI